MNKLFKSDFALLSLGGVFTFLGLLFFIALSGIGFLGIVDLSALSFFNNVNPETSIFGVILKDVSVLGNIYYAFFIFNIVLVYILYRYTYDNTVIFLLLTNLSLLYSKLLKITFGRIRPLGEDIYDPIPALSSELSYPSTHTLYYTVFWGFVIYLMTKLTRIPLFARKIIQFFGIYMIVFVGLSRVYLRAHWATDIIGGYFFGTGFLALLIYLHRNYSRT